MAKVLLTYTGRRMGGAKVYHCFQTPQGKDLFFGPGFSRCVIGARYEGEVKRGGHALSRKAHAVDFDHHKKRDVARWEAEDLLVQRELDATKTARKARRSSPLAQLAAALQPLVAGRPYTEQRKFIEALCDMACKLPKSEFKLPRKEDLEAFLADLNKEFEQENP